MADTSFIFADRVARGFFVDEPTGSGRQARPHTASNESVHAQHWIASCHGNSVTMGYRTCSKYLIEKNIKVNGFAAVL